MLKNKAAKRSLSVALALVATLGLAGQGFIRPASAEGSEGESAPAYAGLTYQSKNVVLNKTAKAYEIDKTAANKMSTTEITAFSGGPHGGTGDIAHLTNGNVHYSEGVKLGTDAGKIGWVVLDAGAQYPVHKVLVDLVHDWGSKDLVIQLSTTADFTNPVTVFNNDVDGSLGLGDVVSADFGDAYTASLNSGTLLNTASNVSRVWNFAPVTAQYMRITGEMVGNGTPQGYTCFDEIQMFAYDTTNATGPAGVAPVTFSSAGGTFSEAKKVTLSAAAGAEIYYTTDGSVPTARSTKYTGEIDTATLSNACLIRAVAKENGVMGIPTQGTFAHGMVGNPNVALNKTVKAYKYVESSENAALNKTVKAYWYDKTKENMMGEEIASLTKGDGNGDGTSCTASEAGIVNGTIDNDINHPVYENYENNGGQLWWAVVDLGASKNIGSVLVSFWRDDQPTSAMIQLSDNEQFTDGNTTIYCNDSKFGALVGATQGEPLPCKADVGHTITLETPAQGRYLRIIAHTRNGTMWLNEVKAMTYAETASGNMMGDEFTEFRTGEDGNPRSCTVNEAGIVNGSIDNDINRPTENWLWWAVVDLGASENIGSVLVSFWRDDKPASAMIQLSDNENFTGENVTTVYCNDSKFGALVRATQGEQLPCVADVGYTITLETPAQGRYLRIIANTREGTMWLNEVQANVYVEPFNPAPAVESYLTGMKDAFGEDFGAKEVPNKSTVEEAKALLGTSVNLSDSAGNTYDAVAGTWACANYSATTAGDYTFTFTPTDASSLPVDAYGAMTATVTVLAAPDFTNLNAAITAAQAKTEADYTPNSWTAMQAKLTAANTVKDGKVTQAQVDTATQELNAAVAALAARGDITALQTAYNANKDKQENAYLSSTWGAFNTARTEAKTLLDNPANASQAEIDAKKTALETAATALVARANVTELKAEYDKQKTAYGVADTNDKYVRADWAAYVTAMDNAKEIIDNNDVVQKAADDAKTAITTAVQKLKELASADSKTALQGKVNQYKDKESSYVAATWTQFKPVLEAAKTALEADPAFKADIDKAATDLDAAIAKLVAIGDSTALKALIDTKVEEETKYTAESWAAYKKALADANSAADGKHSQADIDAAKTALDTAIKGLEKAKSGCGSALSAAPIAFAGMIALAGVALVIAKKKKKN